MSEDDGGSNRSGARSPHSRPRLARTAAVTAAIWIALQAALHLAIVAPTGSPANVDWWLALSSLQLERGLTRVWTPYPPVFPALHAALTRAVAGDDAPQLQRYFFEGDRSGESTAAHARVLARMERAWIAANLLLLLALAALIGWMVRRREGAWPLAALAGAAFLLASIAPESRVRVGLASDQFDYLPALLLLGSVALLAARRPLASAAVAGAGIATKLFPFVAIPIACARARSWREAAAPAAVALVIVGALAAPLALTDRDAFLSTWRFSGERGGWESVWLFPEKKWPPMPAARAMPGMFGEPLPTTLVVLIDGRRLAGTIVREDADAIVLRSEGAEQRIARADIAGTGARRKPPLPLRLLALAAFALAALAPFAARRALDSERGVADAALLSITLLLFFSPGVSSYYFLWLVPLLFVTFPPEIAMAVTAAFLFAGNLELHRWPDVPLYWPALALRQAILGGVALATVRNLRSRAPAPAGAEPANAASA